jgi:hypothetical protein
MDTEDLTQERIATNQSTFREANETIEAVADRMHLTGLIGFMCECADRTCIELIQMTGEEYESVRRHPRRFFTLSGHESLSVGAGAAVVTEQRTRYVIVEKIGVAGEIAAERYDQLS